MLEDVAVGCGVEGGGGALQRRMQHPEGCRGAPVGAEPNTHFLCATHHPVSLHHREPWIESLEHGTQEKLFFPLI